MLNRRRLIVLFVFGALYAATAFAQYETPTVDGTIDVGEYAHNSGNWYVTWDDTWLYGGIKAAASSENISIYLDLDPLSTPGGGTGANGSLTGFADSANNPVTPLTAALPMRADVRILLGQNPNYRLRDGSGGWDDGSSNPGNLGTAKGEVSGDYEFKFRWTTLSSLSGIPSSFAWLAYKNSVSGGATASTEPMPPANSTGTTSIVNNYFFLISSTADGSSTNPFSVRESTWRVTSDAGSGADTLRQAILDANADTASARRYITFSLGTPTITPSTALPNVTQTTTIDGTTQTAGTTPAVTLVGPGTSSGVTGLQLQNTGSGVVRGLIVQNFEKGIRILGGEANTIAGNYIGTNAAGDAAAPNNIGVDVFECQECTIGGASAANRNVISGNSTGIQLADDGDCTIANNYIGVGADGTTAIGNTQAIDADASIELTIGSLTAGNVIAHNSMGVNAVPEGGLLVRGNSMYANAANPLTISGNEQPAPTVSAATVNANIITLTFSMSASSSFFTQSMQLDLYTADDSGAPAQGKTYRTTSPCYVGNSFTNQQWAASPGYSVGSDDFVLIVTSYSEPDCTNPIEGSSEFSSLISPVLSELIFTGPGDFSDTSKWNTSALPLATQDFTIVGACTFDDGAPERDYGNVTLGSGATPGTITWEAGNDVVLSVTELTSAVAGGSITMADAQSALKISGALNPANLSLTVADGSFVEYSGSGQTIADAYTYENLVVSGTGSFSNTLNVDSLLVSGTLTGDSGSTLGPASAIDVTGTLSAHHVQIASGKTVTAKSFSVAGTLTVDGTLSPVAAAEISGSGELTGSGTLNVSGTGFTSQFALSTLTLADMSLVFAGSAAQSTGAVISCKNLTLNNPAGLTMTHHVTVSNTLSLTSGLLGRTGGRLTVSNTSPSAISVGSGWLLGSVGFLVNWNYATGTNTYIWPFGSSTNYAPATVTLHSATVSGISYMAGALLPAIDTSPAGIDPARNSNFLWGIGFQTGALATYDITMQFGTMIDAGASPATFVVRRGRPTGYFASPSTPGATSITITGEPAIVGPDGDSFLIGNQLIDHYIVSAATLQATGVPFPTTVTAKDILGVTVSDDSTTEVLLSSSTNNALFDGDGDGAFGETGDERKTLTNGTLTMPTRVDTEETLTIQAEDEGEEATGVSDEIVVIAEPSTTTTQITPGAETLFADGTASTVITVQLKDGTGADILTDAATVALSATAGTLGSVSYAGSGSYTATFTAPATVGVATITGTLDGDDIADDAVITLTAGPAVNFLVEAPASAIAGTAFDLLVTARDAQGRTVTEYTGTVTFTSTDPNATLQPNYTYVGGDFGVHEFSTIFGSVGSIGITARDTVTSSIAGSDLVAVTAESTTVLVSSASPSLVGQAVTFTATVSSAYSGTISGNVAFKDGAATLATVALSGGSASFTTSALAEGTHFVSAVYSGNTNFNASESDTMLQVVNLASFGAPSIVYAAATSTSSVSLSWTSVADATSYRVYRSSGGGLFSQIASVATPSHVDGGRAANTTYLYKITADNGSESGFSPVEAATTTIFTDATLSSSISVKKTHLDELRTAVNAMRTAAGLSNATFTDPTITAQSTTMKRLHIVELRTALDAARATIGLPALTYTDPTITAQSTKVKAIHLTELRAGTQ